MLGNTHIVPSACRASNTSPIEKWHRSIDRTWQSLGERFAGRRRASLVAAVLQNAARGTTDPRKPGLMRRIFKQLERHGIDLAVPMSEWFGTQRKQRRLRKSR